jgi:hypothetical protein
VPTLVAKLLLLLACTAITALAIRGRSLLGSLLGNARRQPLDAASAAIGVLFAYSIALNALGYLSDAYVWWLCGERDTPPTAWELFTLQLPVLAVTTSLVAAVFRELRRYLDEPDTAPRLGFAAVRAAATFVAAMLVGAVADRLPGLLATAAHVASSGLVVLAVEILVVIAASCCRARYRPDEAPSEGVEHEHLAGGLDRVGAGGVAHPAGEEHDVAAERRLRPHRDDVPAQLERRVRQHRAPEAEAEVEPEHRARSRGARP